MLALIINYHLVERTKLSLKPVGLNFFLVFNNSMGDRIDKPDRNDVEEVRKIRKVVRIFY